MLMAKLALRYAQSASSSSFCHSKRLFGALAVVLERKGSLNSSYAVPELLDLGRCVDSITSLV